MFLLKYSYLAIKICCKCRDLLIFKVTIGDIIKYGRKKRESLTSSEKIVSNAYPRIKLNSLNIVKVRSLKLKECLQRQKTDAKSVSK